MEPSEKTAKIKWACRRGMLELDFILNEFLESTFLDFTEQEQDELLIFLENEDPDLYAWLMGFRQPTNEADITMVKKIKTKKTNVEQPNSSVK